MFLPRGAIPGPPLLRTIFSVVLVVLMLSVAGMKFYRSQQPRESTFRDLSVQAPLTEIGSIAVDGSVQGTLGDGERQAWTLAANKGQRVAISLDGDWDSHLAVYMPDGIQTLTQDGFSAGGGQALIEGVTLPEDGTYTIAVRGENGGSGAYQLHVTTITTPAPPATLQRVGPGDGAIVIGN